MRALAVVLIPLTFVAGLALSTQVAASALGHPAALGPPALTLLGIPLYAPWAWLRWRDRYAAAQPAVFRNASGLSTVGALASLLVAAAVGAGRRRVARSTAHGSSRWATTREIERAGLLRDAGVVLCQTADAEFQTSLERDAAVRTKVRRLGRLVRHDGPEHVFCFAPTRSGKGVGLVVPTLLSWPHSVLVYDIKKENWSLTAGWRQQFSHVLRFEPTALDSVRFNPLLEIRKGPSEVKDTQNVADILVDPTGESERRDHWQSTAQTLLTGAILHVLYAEPEKTLSRIAALLADPARPQDDTLQRMLTTRHLPAGPHPVVAAAAREMLNKSTNERSGVFSTALACLGLYRDPVIAHSTSTSDFRIADLMNAPHPVSLYLVVPPSDLARTRPIVRLVLNQVGRRLTESMPLGDGHGYRHRLLLLLDEFPSLGRLEFFENALAFLAGYGIKAFLIAQSLNQLEKAYGPYSAILDNCHVRFTYAPNDDKTARRISDLLGQATEQKVQKSYSGSGLFLTHRSESAHEFGRCLLTPAEVNQLPHDDGLLLVGGLLPYRARKVRYFLDPRFAGRAGLPPPDSPEAQAREIFGSVPSEWDGVVAVVPTASESATPSAVASEPGSPNQSVSLTTPNSATAVGVQSAVPKRDWL